MIILPLFRLILHLLFSSGIIIPSRGSCFAILSLVDLVTAYAILFSKNSPASWTTFLEAVFREPSPVSNNCLLYFLANHENPYPFTYFLDLGSEEYRRIAKLEKRVISVY